MDESIPWDQKCKSSKELCKIKSSVDTIFDEVEHGKQTIAKRTYFGHIDPFIQNTIEGNFSPQIHAVLVDLEKFHLCLKEEMVDDLRYFNSLEHEVDTLKSQLKTQKTQFLNEINRLSRVYYYVDQMNAILGVYTKLDEVTNLQCDYLEVLEKCERLEKELSKITENVNKKYFNELSKRFSELKQHSINLELTLQQSQVQLNNDKVWKQKESTSFRDLNVKYFEIQDLEAQLQDKSIAISELKKLIVKMKGKSMDTNTKEPKRNVNQSVATPLKKTVAAYATNQKPRSTTRKQYEHVILRSHHQDINGNLRLGSTLSNTSWSSNSFAARTVKFRNDQIALILGYGDLDQGNITITRVYYVEAEGSFGALRINTATQA
ncbi:hypothetical protein Tco_0088665 [Tanacetum coccineum]